MDSKELDMAAHVLDFDRSVTKEKVDELQRRIVAKADPLKIVAFGSRARGITAKTATLISSLFSMRHRKRCIGCCRIQFCRTYP